MGPRTLDLVAFATEIPGSSADVHGQSQHVHAEDIPLAHSEYRPVGDIPRTRNAKILRRVVRSVYTGADPGDLSSLENPNALAAISATRS